MTNTELEIFINSHPDKFIVLDGICGERAIIYPINDKKYIKIGSRYCIGVEDPRHRCDWTGEWDVQGVYDKLEHILVVCPEILNGVDWSN